MISTTNVQTVRRSHTYYRQTDPIKSSLRSFLFLVSFPIRNHNINSYPFTPPLRNFIYHAFTRIRISLGCRPWGLVPWTRRLIPHTTTSQGVKFLVYAPFAHDDRAVFGAKPRYKHEKVNTTDDKTTHGCVFFYSFALTVTSCPPRQK